MKHVMSGKDLIVLEAKSASELLYVMEFLLSRSSSGLDERKKLIRELMSKYENGFTVWQELKDRTKETMG